MKRYPNSIKIVAISILLLMTSSLVVAQDTLTSVFRPRIGLGTGTIGYYGEIQNYQKTFTPTVNKIGGLAYLNAPVNRFINAEFQAAFGKVTTNERTLYRNLNFESRIRSLSLNLYYNFWPMINADKTRFNPFVGVGISSIEFLSRTDLYDRQGRAYNYWSDGSIRDIPEDAPNAPTDAIYVYRDYNYETDLRSLDADGLGKYKEQSFGFPFTFGMNWRLSQRWDFRLATTWTLTLTDLIDNISPAGTGIRQGDKSNDRLLFTYVSMSYDLMFEDKSNRMRDGDFGIDYFVGWDSYDWDKDGVIDALDRCAATPLEAKVDTSGCPLDADNDGVPDYMDDEAGTPAANYVDEFGVSITEEQFRRHLDLYYDSTGIFQEFIEIKTVVNSGKSNRTTRKDPLENLAGKNYVIVMGKERKGISANDLHKFLGFTDFKTVIKNDTVYYVMGEYKSIQDAVAAKDQLEGLGIEIESVSTNNQTHNIIKPIEREIIDKVKQVNADENREAPELALDKTVYMVQIGAFTKQVDTKDAFKDINDVFYAADKSGITRYYTGKYDTWEAAANRKTELQAQGLKKSFVVAYEKGARITLKEAGVKKEDLPADYSEKKEIETFSETKGESILTGSEKDKNAPVIINGINMADVRYRIKLGEYKGEIPIEVFNIYSSIGGIKSVKNFDGSTTYFSRQFNTEKERDAAIKEYKDYELDDVSPATEYDGKFYTSKEFKALLVE